MIMFKVPEKGMVALFCSFCCLSFVFSVVFMVTSAVAYARARNTH